MKTSDIICSIIILVLLATIIFNRTQQLCFPEKCFEIEKAITSEERAMGLMFREYLPENSGMLFIFPESGIYQFWMKNTLIPLDIIWLNENYKVVQIEHVEPCQSNPCPIYNPEKEAKYVLEVNSRLTDKYSIQVESQAKLK
ncbi:hypothetical protein COU62_01815 [Candidatus Pacearchaeota archaeon CG10_big_fil_rev_8_21_14_0_10_35_219]|nr:DUF192 domain-containing protein [Candidatus Pacearchaeota archaeon]OIO42552.1 MAG: hypothetical protein AUJ63_02610 [Candidatus Pacearchaeota archaeon CG1_02_35_32]PIO07929.1 MAG: hypothetical protein COU62_01815 [Candidatus Pacearchaeota archaeon CG10_big_fil_rev_8_21_14_0_10_35_219]PIY81605.1 MAG: hypothetical protein COY79_01785 [Candidatus Pacearchaeota archaeon CG_4_10_14_0_8_um_filter_35_169]PIZ80646.1 MAG: hypothetical protein COY00_00785 [Candidatus Pacearchaeota archaeon CG_4_10_14